MVKEVNLGSALGNESPIDRTAFLISASIVEKGICKVEKCINYINFYPSLLFHVGTPLSLCQLNEGSRCHAETDRPKLRGRLTVFLTLAWISKEIRVTQEFLWQ